ncbi:MAG: sugar transferase [Flavobacteriales bacterium]|nr:sugar transferase [Flavobacteriales bacterium]
MEAHSLRRKVRIFSCLADVVSAAGAWTILFFSRKIWAETRLMGMPAPLESDQNFYLGLALTVFYWLGLFYGAGLYQDPFRISRLQALGLNFSLGIGGSILIFLVLFLDDLVPDYRWYYFHLCLYGGVFLVFSFLFRLSILTIFHRLIAAGKAGFPTVLLMPAAQAEKWALSLTMPGRRAGHKVLGYFAPDDSSSSSLPHLGPWREAAQFILCHGVEEVIVDHSLRSDPIVTQLYGTPVRLRMIPENGELLTGSVRQSALFGALLVDFVPVSMPHWQQVIKRAFDVGAALAVLTLGAPLLIAIALWVRSDGHPALFTQERIGRYGKPFTILKFRTMRPDAEAEGPALSRADDPRITPVGRILRKYRLDELPQFINVLRGEMSLVGPRPERRHFIDQIVQVAPQYRFLLRVRPGITSWGMVMYGYASSVPEMLKRMRYDILYVENMSLALDLRILLHTVLTVLRGEGK